MRKTLLLLLILTSGISSLQAQKSVLISDSTYFNTFPGTPLSVVEWDKHIYNSNCLDSVSQHLYVAKPLDTTQQLKDYYPNGNIYHQVNQSWDTAADAYANHSRFTYYYDAANRNSQISTESWVNNSWQPSNLTSYYYSSNGKLDTLLTQYWNGVTQTYVDQYEDIYTYDAYGNVSSFLSQYQDAGSGNWQPSYGFTYLYNAGGFLLDFTLSSENFMTGTYGLLAHTVNYPDSLNRTDSAYNTNYEFEDSVRYYYTYYPSSATTA